eukprot:scaffold26131_cov211-Cylindrotheca_fusiformis.AAC.1
MDSCQTKVKIVQDHYERKGYRVHSGLQFGCELVLYADDPENVHSDFCIHIVRDDTDGMLDWREIQTLVRSMPDFHKTLILAKVRTDERGDSVVEELAMATEHAPFRHKQKLIGEAGLQRKKPKTQTEQVANLGWPAICYMQEHEETPGGAVAVIGRKMKDWCLVLIGWYDERVDAAKLMMS